MFTKRSVAVLTTVVAVFATAQPAEASGNELWVHKLSGVAVCDLTAVSSAADWDGGVAYGLYDEDTCGSHASLLVAYTAAGARKWAVENTTHDDVPVGVVVDPRTQTVLIAGTRNNDELLVQAYDPHDGHELWGKGLIASGGAFETDGLALDGHDRVIVSGTVTRNSASSWSTAAFDIATGATLWHVHYSGRAGLGATATAIAGDTTSESSQVSIVGTAVAAGGRRNLVTLSYDTATGDIAWAHEVGGLHPEPVGVAVDRNTNRTYTLTGSSTTTAAQTFAYSSKGALLWQQSYDGADGDGVQPRAIAVDPLRHKIYVAGEEASSFTTLVAYSGTGDQLWTDSDPAAPAIAESITADSEDRVYVTSDLITGADTSSIVTFADTWHGVRQWRDVYAVSGATLVPYGFSNDPTRNEEYLAGAQSGPSDELTSVMIAYQH